VRSDRHMNQRQTESFQYNNEFYIPLKSQCKLT
jgi:hypothetical protein